MGSRDIEGEGGEGLKYSTPLPTLRIYLQISLQKRGRRD